MLGGIINACALGRIAILIGWNEEKVKTLIKAQAYWDYLGSVGKKTFRTNNLIILSPEQFAFAVNEQLK